jgi:anti-sigma regulatory factor (Ser/Thr protein kinase)
MSPLGNSTHQALFYRDDGEYVEGLRRFLTPARGSGDPIAISVPEHKLELVREQLSDWSDKELFDMSEVGRNPGRILSVIERLRQERPGRMLHSIGEPIWAGRTKEEIREAVRHEALLNVMLEDTPMRVLCPYDALALDDAVLASAKRTHPEIVENGAMRSSCCYSEAIPPECEVPLSTPPEEASNYVIKEGMLSTLRAAVRDHGRNAGFGGELIEDLQLVANELVTNALRYGAPRRQLTVWGTSDEMICQVENEGAISDPLAGRRNPLPHAKSGMGLWIVHQLSALVEMRDGARTTVRAHLVA